jgi:predicted peroxiredoxin
MADKLLIIMVNTAPESPSAVTTVLNQATVAAAMEYDVEVIFTGRSGQLAIKGVAKDIVLSSGYNKTAYTLIQEAHEAGVHFKVCATTLEQWGDQLIPEVEETVGGAYIISEAMDEHTVTLTY